MRNLFKGVIGLAVSVLILGAVTVGHSTPTLPLNQKLEKSGMWLQNATESSWFVWNNELYYIYANRSIAGPAINMKIIKFSDQSVVATFGTDYGCQDVLVDGGTLYVFATKCYMDFSHTANSIVKFTSTDLTNWSGPATIYTGGSYEQIYNVGVGKDASGNVVIGYDIHNPSWYAEYFVTRFITSTNYTTWSNIGTASNVWHGHGCADLKFVNGAWYIWGFSDMPGGGWATISAKTTDFLNFTNSKIPTIKPVHEWEDINTTDPDLIEFDGKVYISYMTGDQSTYARLTYATYEGTLAQLIDVYQQPN